jgi:septal ring factor EnvC (AmiA/AmiB activator)
MAIEVQKIMNVEATEWRQLIELAKLRRAEVIRLKNDYIESQSETLKRNCVAMQKEEIARLEAVLAAKRAQLARMRHTARNATKELAEIDARIAQLNENLSGRLRLEKMQEMKMYFKAMQKAGITPPEVGATVTEEDIVS